MARIYTPAIIAEIVRRANLGAGAQAIANDLGLNVNSLRVKCSGLGISLRRCREARTIAREKRARCFPGSPLLVVVPRLALVQLRQWSVSKNMSVEALAAELLAVIAADGLCDAILDDDMDSPSLAPGTAVSDRPCRSPIGLARPDKDKSVA
jgi:hypothetical protein